MNPTYYLARNTNNTSWYTNTAHASFDGEPFTTTDWEFGTFVYKSDLYDENSIQILATEELEFIVPSDDMVCHINLFKLKKSLV